MEAKALSPSPSARDETPSQGTAQTEGAGRGGGQGACWAARQSGFTGALGEGKRSAWVFPQTQTHTEGPWGRPCPPSPSLCLPRAPPEHGEGGRAVGDTHRGLWRVLLHPADAHHRLCLRVEVGPMGMGGRALGRGPVVLERGSRGQVHPFSFKSSHSARAAQRLLPPCLPRQQPHPAPSALPAGQQYPHLSTSARCLTAAVIWGMCTCQGGPTVLSSPALCCAHTVPCPHCLAQKAPALLSSAFCMSSLWVPP